jgi:hypothetical protein
MFGQATRCSSHFGSRVIRSPLDRASEPSPNEQESREKGQHRDRHAPIQRKHDRKVHCEEDEGPHHRVHNVSPELRDLFHVLLDPAKLLSKERTFMPIGRELHHVSEQLYPEILSQQLGNAEAEKTPQPCQAGSPNKAECYQQYRPERIDRSPSWQRDIDKMPHKQRIESRRRSSEHRGNETE